MGPYGYGMVYGASPFLSLLWWVITIVVIFWVIRFVFGGGRHHTHNRNWSAPWEGKSALDILKERYVKGEINKEEYEEKKKTLEL
jgi:putative membrane protein